MARPVITLRQQPSLEKVGTEAYMIDTLSYLLHSNDIKPCTKQGQKFEFAFMCGAEAAGQNTHNLKLRIMFEGTCLGV